MKKQIWLVALVFFLGLSAAHATSVEEFLMKPNAERVEKVKSQPMAFQQALRKLAFNESVDFDLRWKAVVLLPVINRSRGLLELEKASQSKRWFMRNAALVAMEEYYPDKSKQLARRLLNDPALVVRSAAVQVLSKNIESQDRALLWGALDAKINFRKKQSLFIREQILTELAKNPEPKEKKNFVRLLSESEMLMFKPAIQGLERIANKSLGQGDDSIETKRDLWLSAENKESQTDDILR